MYNKARAKLYLLKKAYSLLILKIKNKRNIIALSPSHDLTTKKKTFNLKIDVDVDHLIVRGDLFSIEQKAKSAVFTARFYDINNNEVLLANSYDFKANHNHNCYKYLPTKANDNTSFSFILPIPIKTSFCRLEIHCFKNTKELKLRNFVCKSSILKTRKILNFLENKRESISSDEALALFEDELTPKKLTDGLEECYNYFKTKGDLTLAATIGTLLFREKSDIIIATDVKNILTKIGHMTKTKEFIDEVNRQNLAGWKFSSKRITNDLEWMQKGFTPSPHKDLKHKVLKNVLYLLHNSLPYNSGGYATRTHGLLTGINLNTSFQVSGVTRPGYPSDHKRYISHKIPNTIPNCDNVDDIKYLRCSQKFRKSSYTLSEYLETYAKEIEEYAIDRQCSIIHGASNYPNGFAAVEAAHLAGIASVYEVRGLWEITRLSRQKGWDKTENFEFMAKMEAEACKNADAVITITDALKEILISRGVNEEKITVVPNCVNFDHFSSVESRDQTLAKELNISADDVVIGYIGSVVSYEGLDDLISVIGILKREGIRNFKFLMVGDGDFLSTVKDAIVAEKVEDLVICTGRIPYEKVKDYYSLIDIAPFPRKPLLVCEAVSPLKPFEALASQKAVIVSSCDALTEIITHNETGLVFEKGNNHDFAEKLKNLIHDKELRTLLARQGRKWVKENRDWKTAAGIINTVYNKVLAKRNLQC